MGYIVVYYKGDKMPFGMHNSERSEIIDQCFLPVILSSMLSVTIFQELQKEKEKNSDSDEAFQETEWVDLSEPFPGKRKKKVK